MSDGNQQSYIITSFAPAEIGEKFLHAKKKFHIFLPQERDLEKNTLHNPAHITLKGSFYLKNGITEDSMIASIDTLVFTRFPVTATKVDVFTSEKVGNIVIALIEQNPLLFTVHNTLYELLTPMITESKPFEGQNYHPHLSILYNVPLHKIDDTVQYANAAIMPLQFMFDNVCILKEVPGKRQREMVRSYIL